jgi:hypothetical protein
VVAEIPLMFTELVSFRTSYILQSTLTLFHMIIMITDLEQDPNKRILMRPEPHPQRWLEHLLESGNLNFLPLNNLIK